MAMPISDDLQQTVTGNVRAALAEDVGSGDVTAELIEAITEMTTVMDNTVVNGTLIDAALALSSSVN